MMGAFNTVGQGEGALELMNEARSHGLVPNAFMYSVCMFVKYAMYSCAYVLRGWPNVQR
jgi:pentatricopeptide repeat protein